MNALIKILNLFKPTPFHGGFFPAERLIQKYCFVRNQPVMNGDRRNYLFSGVQDDGESRFRLTQNWSHPSLRNLIPIENPYRTANIWICSWRRIYNCFSLSNFLENKETSVLYLWDKNCRKFLESLLLRPRSSLGYIISVASEIFLVVIYSPNQDVFVSVDWNDLWATGGKICWILPAGSPVAGFVFKIIYELI